MHVCGFNWEIGTIGEIVEICPVFGAKVFSSICVMDQGAVSRGWAGHGTWDKGSVGISASFYWKSAGVNGGGDVGIVIGRVEDLWLSFRNLVRNCTEKWVEFL